MKTFKRIYLVSTIAFLTIWTLAFLQYHRLQEKNNHSNVVNMNRLSAEFESLLLEEGKSPEEILNENPDVWKDVTFIPGEAREENKVQMISGDGRDYFWSIFDANGEYLGMLQFSEGDRAGNGLPWLVGGMIGSFILIQIVLLLFYKMYILPLHQLEQYPVRIAKGDIAEHLPETQYRNLGNFVWGINMLSDTLVKRQEALNKAQAEKNSFLTGIAHGVKTPIANIKLYSEAIATGLYQPDSVPNESDREIADKIQKNAEDIEELISKLLLTAADGNYAYEPEIGSFYLKDLGERIRQNYDNRMKVNRIPFEVQVIENAIVQSDEDGIHTILSQFVENAVKYGDGSGIRIVMEKQEDTYYFSVFNKGELLPDSELPYVFRSFWRGSNAESKPGSGMGMYTAREMAKQLRGEVYVRALKEQGEMEFTLII